MATAVKNQTLDELYENPKITPSILKYIREKEDFTSIQERYCKICPAPCKSRMPSLNGTWTQKTRNEDPVMVILPHRYMDEEKNGRTTVVGSDRTKRIVDMISEPLNMPAFFTPAYLCTQQDYKVPLKVVKHCSSYIQQLVKGTRPKAILACGPNALQTLGLKGSRGDTLYWGPERIPVVATYDPRILFMIRQNSSGDCWGPDYISILLRDLRKVKDLANGIRPPSLEQAVEKAKQQLVITKSMAQVYEMLETLGNEKVVSFDIETSTLDPWSETAKILTAQFGTEDGTKAWVVTLWHKDMPEDWYDPNEAWVALAPLLVDPNILKVGHNIKFDALYVRVTKNLKVMPIEDTMLYMHSLNSGTQGEYGLKPAVQDFLWETGLGGYEDLL